VDEARHEKHPRDAEFASHPATLLDRTAAGQIRVRGRVPLRRFREATPARRTVARAQRRRCRVTKKK
jgi:hypothetical protein